MEFTTKDFEAIGDTIEFQKKVLRGFEFLLAGLVISPLLHKMILELKKMMPKELREAMDKYIDMRNAELFHKKPLD